MRTRKTHKIKDREKDLLYCGIKSWRYVLFCADYWEGVDCQRCLRNLPPDYPLKSWERWRQDFRVIAAPVLQ